MKMGGREHWLTRRQERLSLFPRIGRGGDGWRLGNETL